MGVGGWLVWCKHGMSVGCGGSEECVAWKVLKV